MERHTRSGPNPRTDLKRRRVGWNGDGRLGNGKRREHKDTRGCALCCMGREDLGANVHNLVIVVAI